MVDAITNKSLTPGDRKWKYGLAIALICAILWSIVAVVVRILQGRDQDAEQKSKMDHDGLVGALYVIWNLVNTSAKSGKLSHNQLRLTVHRVVPPEHTDESSEWFEQLVPYCGGDGKSAGRKSSIRSGIVGRVVREKVPKVGKRPTQDYEEYIRILKSEWSYTDSDARRLTSDRMSWMAVPILDSKGANVVAVLYLDSNDPNFFTQQVQNQILNASGGVAKYLQDKYGGS